MFLLKLLCLFSILYCAFIVRLQLEKSYLETVPDQNNTSKFIGIGVNGLLRGNGRNSSEFNTPTPIVSSDTPHNNAWRLIPWRKDQESSQDEYHKQWQEKYHRKTRQLQRNKSLNMQLERDKKLRSVIKKHHEMQAQISEKRDIYWNQLHEKRRRIQDDDERQQLPEKGDTDCDVFVDDIFSDILNSNSTTPILTSFLPLPRPCREGADGPAEEDVPIIPPLSELLPGIFNPDKNAIPIMFAVALRDPLYEISELKEAMAEVVTSFFNRTFTFDNGDTYNNIVLVFQDPKESDGDGTRRIQSTGGTGSRFNRIIDAERRIQSDFDGGVWTMTHQSTDMKPIPLINHRERYSWWEVTILYNIFELTEEGVLEPESDPNTLYEITHAVRLVVEEAVDNTKFLIEMRSKLHSEEVWGVAMAGQEPPHLTEPVATAEINSASAEDGAGKYGRGQRPDSYQIPLWGYRQDIGLVLVLATSFSTIIMFFLASKRKELRKEQRWWGIRFTEQGLNDFLRYGYKIEKGGVMITTDFGPKGPGYSDDSSIYKGESSQPHINKEIVTSETLYNIASQQQQQQQQQQQLQHNTADDAGLAGAAYMNYGHADEHMGGPAAVLPNCDIGTNNPAGEMLSNPNGIEKREKSPASDRTPAADTDPTRNISADSQATPPTPIVNTPNYNNVFPSNNDNDDYDYDDDDDDDDDDYDYDDDDDDDGSSYI